MEYFSKSKNQTLKIFGITNNSKVCIRAGYFIQLPEQQYKQVQLLFVLRHINEVNNTKDEKMKEYLIENYNQQNKWRKK